MKYCIDKYPMGSFKGQRSPGKYIDAWLYQNLEMLADRIIDDMTFMSIIFSSTLEVGSGKSVLATQIGEAWEEIIKKKHNIDLGYNVDNIVWRPKDLIEKAFKVPKYSYLLLDEWEDATYWSELGMTLRKFFRKCRQLNLFIMCIIPNWFQLPLNYATSRSIFAIDVKFTDKLERGNFSFYNFPSKRALYVLGKKSHNYWASKPTFNGTFPDGYGVDEIEYRKRKLEDMEKYDREEPTKLNKQQLEKKIKSKVLMELIKMFPKLTLKDYGKILNVSYRTVSRWKEGDVDYSDEQEDNYMNIHPNNKKIEENSEEDPYQ
jgi:hypothetical protein